MEDQTSMNPNIIQK